MLIGDYYEFTIVQSLAFIAIALVVTIVASVFVGKKSTEA